MIPTAALARTSTARVSQPVLREARFDDHEQIAALQARNGLNPRTRSHWASLWTDNPAFQTGDPVRLGWVLETTDGTLVGYVGNLPLAYRFQGVAVRAATPHSWAVDPPYRRYSMGLLDRFLSQTDPELFVFATVNAASEAVYRGLGFLRAPSGIWDRSRLWIVRHPEFAAVALRARSPRLPSWLGVPVGAALRLGTLASYLSDRLPQDVELDFCPGFDARFEVFWEQLQRERAGQLLAVRDRATLQWHFGDSLRRQQTWVLTASQQGRLVAYAIFDRWDFGTLQLKRLRVVDFQYLSGFDGLVRPMISAMLRLCRREGIHLAENVGCWLESGGFRGPLTPYRRKMKSWLFYYKARNPQLAEALKQPGVWRTTSFDGDASL